MTRTAARLAATALACAVAAGGCGVGPGEAAEGEATLVVTRDFGAEPLASGTLEGPTPSDTVVRPLASVGPSAPVTATPSAGVFVPSSA